MIIKASEIKGHKLITIDDGKHHRNVEEILFDPKENRIVAFVVDPGGFFSEAEVVMFENVESIGQDAIMIPTEDVLSNVGDVRERVAEINESKNYLTKSRVITETGKELGMITDVYFDTNSGSVDSLEVSEGALQDVASGRKVVRIEDIVTIGEDAIIVSAFTEQDLDAQAQEQGLQGLVNKGRDKLEEGKSKVEQGRENLQSEDAQTQIQEIRKDVESKLQNAAEKIKSGIQNLGGELKDKTKENVIGKYASKNILAQNDELIISKGEMITNEVVKRAEAEGLLEQILMNSTSENTDPVAS